MDIDVVDPERAAPLIEELDAYQRSLYPPESNHLDSLDVLRRENVILLGALAGDEVCAIGAAKLFDGYAEIKRVFVPERHRRKGLARRLMEELEARIRERGLPWARLETGIRQPEALGLYEALGYRPCAPFGEYRPDPLSIFLEKRLAGVDRSP